MKGFHLADQKTAARRSSGDRDRGTPKKNYDVTGVEGAEVLTTPVGPSGRAIHRTA